jgi:GT2 family glycosyltransferase
MTANKVFVIIVTFNGKRWISQCLNSLRESSTPLTVIVIDNCSDDGTQGVIRKDFPEVTFIQAEHNLGFGRANNVGMQKALDEGADYVFLLNQDAWIEAGTISALIEIHQHNTHFGILSPMHLNATYTALDYNFSRYISPDLCPDLYSDIYTKNLNKVYPAAFINAAAWLISRQCLEKVGLFDPLFFHYGEDRNYTQRAVYYGFEIGVCPSERIVHDRGTRKGVLKGFDGKKERQRMMLVSLADVNQINAQANYRKKAVKIFAKILANGIVFNKKGVKDNFSDYLFLVKNKKLIIESINKNRGQ